MKFAFLCLWKTSRKIFRGFMCNRCAFHRPVFIVCLTFIAAVSNYRWFWILNGGKRKKNQAILTNLTCLSKHLKENGGGGPLIQFQFEIRIFRSWSMDLIKFCAIPNELQHASFKPFVSHLLLFIRYANFRRKPEFPAIFSTTNIFIFVHRCNLRLVFQWRPF